MRWDFGKIYKEIRIAKGLTQAEVCGNQFSRTSLSKFESCQSLPNIENMVFLLNQIDMSLEEFRYICNFYKPSKRQEIINLAFNHISITGTKELKELKVLCENYLTSHHDTPIEHINDMLGITIHLRSHGLKSTEKSFLETKEKIWSYLKKQDNWYFIDFQLLNSILFSFPIESLELITEMIFERIEKYEGHTSIKPLKKKLLTNISTIYLYNNFKDRCERVSLKMLELAKEVKRYDSLGFAQVRLGICRGDDDLIEKGLTLLRLTEEDDLVSMLEEEVKKFR